MYAITHAQGQTDIDGLAGETTRVFVGPPNEIDEFLLEVIVGHRPGGYFVVFHANYLTDKFRYLIEGGSHG